MSAFMRRVPLFILLCCAALPHAPLVHAQSPAQMGGEAASQGTITGRVVLGEKGMAGVGVSLALAEFNPRNRPVARTTTDAEGRYRLSGVAAGRYVIQLFAPVYVVEEMGRRSFPPGKPVTLAPGETVEEMNFTLVRGGVVTGRVTDAEGRPLIAQQVFISPADNTTRSYLMPVSRPRTTDDRGIYRFYGLPAGSYRISVGEDPQGANFTMPGRSRYLRTFHPNVTEESQARVVEVREGEETTDVDITVGSRLKTYRASGRVVDAESNQPLAGVRVGYGQLRAENRGVGGAFMMGQPTKARGEFQLEGLTAGRYVAYANDDMSGELYGEPATFEVNETDVANLEIKMRRGTSISGRVSFEGTPASAAFAQLPSLNISVYPVARDAPAPRAARISRINPDLTFSLKGIAPGRVRFELSRYPTLPKGFSLVRVERGGAPLPNGELDMSAATPVGDLNLVLAYGSGIVRGQVKVVNGTLPAQAQMLISARRVGSEASFTRPAQADARGFFLLEGLAAGKYDFHLNLFAPGTGRRPIQQRQRVTVAGSGETTMVFTLDLSEQEAKPEGEVRL